MAAWLLWSVVAAGAGEALPFSRDRINRYSLDGLVRSISIRQGKAVWLGYDLERATLCKVWRAPEGKPGLTEGLTPRSVGTALYDDRSEAGWRLRSAQGEVALEVRYLGCTQREKHFELRWQLRGGERKLSLTERLPIGGHAGGAQAWRSVRAEGLVAGEALVFPEAVSGAWRTEGGERLPVLTKSQWMRVVLP